MTPGEKAATEILELAWIKYSDAMLFPDRKGLYIAEMAWIINKGVYAEVAELRAENERLRELWTRLITRLAHEPYFDPYAMTELKKLQPKQEETK